MHKYTATISWSADSDEAFSSNRYTRGHTWEFDGGVLVPASSSPNSVRLPFSVEAAVDPEEALVAAVSSCHMLSFLVTSYRDEAFGEMETMADGRQWVSRITLDPQINWSGNKMPDAEALAHLHHEAHQICYIANSIRSEIVIQGIN
jgi:organic hydroperoxide reductase OsmC/OhrA